VIIYTDLLVSGFLILLVVTGLVAFVQIEHLFESAVNTRSDASSSMYGFFSNCMNLNCSSELQQKASALNITLVLSPQQMVILFHAK